MTVSRHALESRPLSGAAAVLLAGMTAAFVWWRNSQAAALSDLSYVLDCAYRITIGILPYRDFPFVHPPLTFLVQAAVVAAGGRHYVHHIAYVAVAGGVATVLAWRVMRHVLADVLPSPSPAAWALAVPLTWLGVYSIFPHPFYDPDTTIVILAATLAAWRVERGGFPTGPTLGAGAALALPVFAKQNTGLAFLAGACAGLVLLSVVERRQLQARRGYLLLLAGAAAGLTAGAMAIHLSVGLDHYLHWTIRFAAERRLPRFESMIGVYRNPQLVLWTASAALAWLAAARLAPAARRLTGRLSKPATDPPAAVAGTAVVLLCVPFINVLVAAVRSTDAWDFAEYFLSLWPYVLAASALAAAVEFRFRTGLRRVWPLVLLAAIHGCLMSQQVWGSTYAIWPLLLILLATVLVAAVRPLGRHAPRALAASALVAALSLGVGGRDYSLGNTRLSHVNIFDGEVTGSRLPVLDGLRTPGPWLTDFDELVAWTEQHVPFGDGIILLPGEDPFYYATGRVPRFPVLLFDETDNPYQPGEYLDAARTHGIRWLIVKHRNQARDSMHAQSIATAELTVEFAPVAHLRAYDVYRR